MARLSFTDLRVWIVGASTGIGAALAEELVRRGARLAISARRTELLTAISADRMVVVTADVTDPAGMLQAAEQIRAELGGIDLVIFNAGYWAQMRAESWDDATFDRHIKVNLLGLSHCLNAVLPTMIGQRSGHIASVASVAGYRGMPGAEAYGATKAAQINLLEGLRIALRGKGITVTTINPGFVRTELTKGNRFPMPFLIDADEAAIAIADGLARRRMEIVFPLPMAIMMKAARLLPVRMWTYLMGRRRVQRQSR